MLFNLQNHPYNTHMQAFFVCLFQIELNPFETFSFSKKSAFASTLLFLIIAFLSVSAFDMVITSQSLLIIF